jgi:hypothetical protein
MAQNEMTAMRGLPVRVRLSEGLGACICFAFARTGVTEGDDFIAPSVHEL